MEILLMILCVFGALLLILTVLIQPGKSEMISGMGGLGGQVSNLLGVRQSRNFLQNLTVGLIGGIFVVSLLVNRVFLPTSDTGVRKLSTEGAEIPTNAAPGSPAPSAPQPTQQPPAQQQPR